MKLQFTKLQGLGNDYLYFDVRSANHLPDWPRLAQALSERRFGVGSDGIIVVENSDCALVRMRIWNADGSEAEMCGNGLRGLVKWLYDQGTRDFGDGIETGAGILIPEIVEADHGLARQIRVSMGVPDFSRRAVGMDDSFEDFLSQPITVAETTFIASAVSMGNPHLVIFGDEWALGDLDMWGPRLERHPWFPRRINVHLAEVVDAHTLVLRHWERGVGPTLACGTGAVGAAAVGMHLGLLESPVRVGVPGGWLSVQWQGPGTAAYLTGPSEEVFRGEVTWDEARTFSLAQVDLRKGSAADVV